MKLPENAIESIRAAADIVDVVGEHVVLKRRGRNFTGLCPFHNEKTPSFSVSPELQIYKCFGCGKAGNVFSFMMEYHSMSFGEAAVELAKKYGVSLPKRGSRDDKSAGKREAALKALETASEFFARTLRQSEGAAALQYFENRGFSRETIDKFKLGYAPDDWTKTSDWLRKKGFTNSNMLDSGLIIEKDGKRPYDRFRGRAMFPIRDYLGRTIAFGARRMSEDPDQPKYINSPQSLVYDKSRVLYGLFEGKDALRREKRALIVEGYSDVISLHQAGVENAVASSGTALTREQLKEISKFADGITLVYDADEAGQNAAEKAIDLAAPFGFDIKALTLPEGEDPDSFVKKRGAEAFLDLAAKAEIFVDFLYRRRKSGGALDTPTGKAAFVKNLIGVVRKFPGAIERDFHIQRIASLMNLDDAQLTNIYAELNSPVRERPRREEDSGGDADAKAVRDALLNILPEEKILLQIGLLGQDELNLLFDKFGLNASVFFSDEAKRLFEIILEASEESADFLQEIMLNDAVAERHKRIIAEIAMEVENPSENWEKFGSEIRKFDPVKSANDALLKLQIRKLDARLSEIQRSLRKAPPPEREIEILNEYSRLRAEKENLVKILMGE